MYRFRRDVTKNSHSKGKHRQHCTNIVIEFGFVSVWTSIKGSCIMYIIIMKVFGPGLKFVITGKFYELTCLLF